MPKQITVEVTAMAYDTTAAQDSRTLQPLRLDQEVTVTGADNDAEAIVQALDLAAHDAARRLGTTVATPRPAGDVADELRKVADNAWRVSSNSVAVSRDELYRWARLLTAGCSDDCTCARGVCQQHIGARAFGGNC